MAIIDKVLDNTTSLLAWFSSAARQNAFDYVELETAENSNTFVTRNGSLMSVIELRGVTRILSLDDFKSMVLNLNQKFSSYLGVEGYEIEFFVDRDPDAALQTIRESQTTARHTTKTLGIDLSDVLDERERHLAARSSYEKVLISCWTHPNAIHPDDAKRQKNENRLSQGKVKLPIAEEAQYLLGTVQSLVTQHTSFVNSVLADLEDVGLSASVQPVHEAAMLMRRSLDHAFTNDDWTPVLPGDVIRPRQYSHLPKDDVSGLMWPPLNWQLVPRTFQQVDLQLTKCGGTIYAPMYVDLMPKDIKPFIELFQRAIDTHAPWRITMRLSSGGVETLGLRPSILSFFTWASRENKLLVDAVEQAKQAQLEGATNIRFRIAFATWGPADQEALVRTRAAQIARAVSSWGTCEVRELCGDPTYGLFSTVTGLTTQHIGTPAIAPLYDALFMAPLSRPTSPWDDGAVSLMTTDGKLMPFQPGSSKQDTWIYLAYAGPGSGKSVLMSSINLALTMGSGLVRLPRIGIIDIGPSSSGLISLLRDALPAGRQHEVIHARLRMTHDCAINVLDTQPGSRFPTSTQRAFLVNFITLVTTPAEEDTPFEMMSALVGQVIDEAYQQASDGDRASPKRYDASQSDIVNARLEELRFPLDEDTTWWEIVDYLFEKGCHRESAIAQRYAVPCLPDLASACRAPNIMAENSQFMTRMNASVVDVLQRMLSEISRTLPILAQPTQFDLSSARVVALDIDEVAKKGGAAADRQTAIMYMLARYAIARDFSLVPDTLKELNPRADYQKYHAQRIEEIRTDLKLLCYDEFHRTAGATAVRQQVLLDMREGRKWNTAIMLVSQELDDFDSAMVAMSTGVFIMGSGSQESARKAKEVFGLSEAEYSDMVYRVRSPGAGRGPVFLTLMKAKIMKAKNVRGRVSMLLTNSIGPVEMWAFSSTAEDVILRDRLYAAMGSRQARSILAKHYPGGSAKPELERRAKLRSRQSATFAGEVDERGVDELFTELMTASPE